MLSTIIAASVLGILLAFFLGRRVLSWFGNWLVVADPLQPAIATVVLGGYLPFRAMEAAAIYHQGWAPKVWLTKYAQNAEEAVLASLGIEITPECDFSHLVLQRLGVPEYDIAILEPPCLDTEEELRSAALRAQAEGKKGPIILVTSKSHSRRVKVLWKTLAGASHPAIIRYTERDPFVPDRWFRNSRDAYAVVHEFFGLLNVWLGFPIRAHRP
jgi:uncharacterized SAM-binding protein YcdF (DUF218 family)